MTPYQMGLAAIAVLLLNVWVVWDMRRQPRVCSHCARAHCHDDACLRYGDDEDLWPSVDVVESPAARRA